MDCLCKKKPKGKYFVILGVNKKYYRRSCRHLALDINKLLSGRVASSRKRRVVATTTHTHGSSCSTSPHASAGRRHSIIDFQAHGAPVPYS